MTDSLELIPTRDGAVQIRVHARPRSRGGPKGVHSVQGGALVVRLAAAPVAGAANAELVETLAEALGLAPRDVTLVRGGSSRSKVFAVRGLSASEVRLRLATAL